MHTFVETLTGGERLRRLARWGARSGPPALLHAAPPVFGVLFALLSRRRRVQLTVNLRRARGGRRRVDEPWLVARTFINYASCLAEALAHGRPEAARATARLVGAEHLAALPPDQGLVVVTAHVGAWDAGGALLARDLRRRVTVVMEPEASAHARSLHDAVRAEAGVDVLHVGGEALAALPLLRRLRSGGVVALQLDRAAPSQRSLPVTLFGHPASVPEGPLRLAALARVPLLTIFARRLEAFRYEFHVGAPITLARHPEPPELTAAAQQLAREFEAFVARHPTQWFAFERLGGSGEI